MNKHNNLYYLFQEDQQKNKMSEEKSQQILQSIKAFIGENKNSQPEEPTQEREGREV